MPDLDDSPAPVPAVSSAVRDLRIGEEQRPKHAKPSEYRQQIIRSEFYGPRVERMAALRLVREPLGISLFDGPEDDEDLDEGDDGGEDGE